MLKDLLKLVDSKDLKSFFKQARITKPSSYEIAEKSAIVSKESALALSSVISAVHSALNVIEVTTKNKNNIEKAKLERIDTSTKENYMEQRAGREGRDVSTSWHRLK